MEYGEIFKIFSDFDCIIKIGSSEFLINEQDEGAIVEIKEKKDFSMHVYPTKSPENEKLLSYTLYFSFDGRTFKSSNAKHGELLRFPFSENYLFLKKMSVPITRVTKKQDNIFYDNFSFTLFSFPVAVKVEKDDFQETFYFSTSQSPTPLEKSNFVYFFSKENNKKKIVALVSEKNQTPFEKSGDEIEVDSGKISVLNWFGKINVYGFVEIFEKKSSKIEKTDEYYVLKEKTRESPRLEKNVPISFFESVRAKDYNFARTHLKRSLSEKLSNSHLSSFFPCFENIYRCREKNVFALSSKDTLSFYKINQEGFSITNIEELEDC